MNNTTAIHKRYFLMMMIGLLSACGPGAINLTRSKTDSEAVRTQAAGTAAVLLTRLAAAPVATFTPTMTPTQTSAPSPIPPPEFALDGLRVAYIIDGNLYVQDSGGQPRQLTHGSADSFPKFSDDGQLLTVYRGSDVYRVDADGSGERKLDIGRLLAPLGLGYDSSTAFSLMDFVPHTHQLLFQTSGNDDLLLLDIDSSTIKRFFAPGGQVKYFQASPDGKLAVVWTANELDIVSLDGKTKTRLTGYPPDSQYIETPEIYWTDDSRRISLILSMVKGTPHVDRPEPRTLSQYALDGSRPLEIRLSPLPVNGISDDYKISPDGNWLAYSYCAYAGETDAPKPLGIYLGNLRDGSSRLLEIPGYKGCLGTFKWSPDSKLFIFDDPIFGMFVVDIKGTSTRCNAIRLLGWIDSNRYIFGGVMMGHIGKIGILRVVDLPVSLYRYEGNMTPRTFTFVYSNPK